MSNDKGMTYEQAGVLALGEASSFQGLIGWVTRSLEGHPEVKAEVGLYATVIDVGHNLGIAMSTDGVGTKLLVAEMMDRYDTVGIDCVAMNVNDIICVGAKPLAMLDYIAVQDASSPLLAELGKGLYEGARLADISIPAGEVAQLKEMIAGLRPGYGFDLVGTAFGTVALDRMVVGDGIQDGDLLIGVTSSGLHSNGYTLARKVLLGKFQVDTYLPELGRTVGEEMLTPTRIYVRPVVELLARHPGIKAVLHITGDGFRNLQRVRSEVGFMIDRLPELPPVFELIRREGKVSNVEMAHTFNLGVGLCLVAPPALADPIIAVFHAYGMSASVIGRAFPDPERKIILPALGVVGKKDKFHEGKA